MPAIALANVTTTLPLARFFNPPGKPNEAYATLAFGNAALTYDTYGIPVPPPGTFGMKNEILRIIIQDPPDGYKYVYDPTVRAANPVAPHGTIRIFLDAGAATAMAEFSGAPAATSLPVTVIGQ